MRTYGARSPSEGNLVIAGGEKCDLFWILRGSERRMSTSGMPRTRQFGPKFEDSA
jgi:hypothetical protein